MMAKTSSVWGWGALFLLFGYAVFLHYGLGVPRHGMATEWWQPRQFLLTWPIWGQIEDALGYDYPDASETWHIHTLLLLTPAVLLCASVIAFTKSAIARALAFSAVLSIGLFGFYGFYQDGMWSLLHWRASAIFTSIASVIGFTLAAPWLAASWLRLSTLAKAAVYLPLLVAVVILFRHTTGWDPDLIANFSPWPALPAVGLDVGAYAVVGLLLGLGLGVAGVALYRSYKLLSALAFLAGVALPLWWFASRFGGGEGAGAAGGIGWLVFCGVAFFLASRTGASERQPALLRRAGHLVLGALLAFFPLFVGRAMTEADYNQSRFVIAVEIIDALHVHYLETSGYPEELEDLIELEYIDAIPQPRVGFQLAYDAGWLTQPEFEYRGLGNSYLLEFVSTEWIQCGYTPPYLDEFGKEYEEEEYDEEYADEEEGGAGAWTCPTKRPQLW
jgi:hypothetical protein